jgi:hypothetical protein
MLEPFSGMTASNGFEWRLNWSHPMKTAALIFSALLSLSPALVSTAQATDHCTAAQCNLPPTVTAFEIARTYAKGGEFAGPTSGTTGTALDVARVSLSFPGTHDRVASTWTPGRIMAKGG